MAKANIITAYLNISDRFVNTHFLILVLIFFIILVN